MNLYLSRTKIDSFCGSSTDYVFAKSMEEIEEVFAKSTLTIFELPKIVRTAQK